MSIPVDFTMSAFLNESASQLSKRLKFTPPSFLPMISSVDNSGFEHHTFSSPILPQLSSQAPSPEEIEASLLQVGMRVRKSVNEGYKNSPQKKFTPRPFANNFHRLSPETQKALLAGTADTAMEHEPFSAGGLHNVGSMAMQPLATATFCGINLAMMPAWASEDHTAIEEQQMWSYTTSSKRGYEGDSDSDESQDWQPQTPTLTPEYGSAMPMGHFNIDVDNMSDVGPFTQPDQLVNHRGRRMAKPRSRLRGNHMNGVEEMPMPPTNAFNVFADLQMLPERQQPQQMLDFSHHKRGMSCGMEANIMDFGEAPFLQRREDVEMDCS